MCIETNTIAIRLTYIHIISGLKLLNISFNRGLVIFREKNVILRLAIPSQLRIAGGFAERTT